MGRLREALVFLSRCLHCAGTGSEEICTSVPLAGTRSLKILAVQSTCAQPLTALSPAVHLFSYRPHWSGDAPTAASESTDTGPAKIYPGIHVIAHSARLCLGLAPRIALQSQAEGERTVQTRTPHRKPQQDQRRDPPDFLLPVYRGHRSTDRPTSNLDQRHALSDLTSRAFPTAPLQPPATLSASTLSPLRHHFVDF
ncbi:hypothetical protein CDD83_1456 [Cordyceps sp. RAO-2017]|nr:hypothetical protein CDD83_1456 [Cordyceps sp. RAO-2017]